ncbi:MAG: flavin reductase family protein [Acidimicrobiales bacterium]
MENGDQDTFDRRRRRVLWKMPSGLYLVGSRHHDQRNLMTLNWATQVSLQPKLLAVSIEQSAVTHGLVQGGKAFSLCVLDRADRAVVRKFTKPVPAASLGADKSDSTDTLGREQSTSGSGWAAVQPSAYLMAGFPCRDGVTGVPLLDQALATIECEVRREVPTGSHTLFIGEVVAASFKGEEAETADVLRMEDTRMNYGG